MLNPQNTTLLEEHSIDKLKKFELAEITLPYTSDMLLCRIPAYVKSTMVGKLALIPIEKYSQEAKGDWRHTNPSKFPSHSTTLNTSSHWKQARTRHITLILKPERASESFSTSAEPNL